MKLKVNKIFTKKTRKNLEIKIIRTEMEKKNYMTNCY